MPKLIQQNQASFMMGRSISNNLVIVQEIVHSLRNLKGRKIGMIFKVDPEKAYDRIRRDCLWETFLEVGLPPPFVDFNNYELCVFGYISSSLEWYENK